MPKRVTLWAQLPHIHQAKALQSTKPVVVCVAGARGGKTNAGVKAVVRRAVEQPGLLEQDYLADQPYLIGVGAPTYPLLEKVIIPEVLSAFPKELIVGSFNKSTGLLQVRGRCGLTHIRFVSASEPQLWYGMRLNYLWIDEFALIKEEMFDEGMTRLSDRQGQMFLTGTPQGPNWAKKRLYDEFKKGSDQIDFFTWRTIDNPFINTQHILNLKEEMPKRYYDRTFEATWDVFAGQVYEEFLRSLHAVTLEEVELVFPAPRRKQAPRMGAGVQHNLVKIFAGIDWGFGQGHAGAIVVVGVDEYGTHFVLDTSYGEGIPVWTDNQTDNWVNRAKKLQKTWGIQTFYGDPARPEHLKTFQREGVRILKARNAVLPGIEAVASLISPHAVTGRPKLRILDTPENQILMDELTFYHWKPGVLKEQPEKIHDNTVDALRYGIFSSGGGLPLIQYEAGYVPPSGRY